MTPAENSHILIGAQGVACIDDTRLKVIDLVKEMLAPSATAEQLHAMFPDLSRAQIHAALAYYYDHQAQVDMQIKQESASYDADKQSSPTTPGRDKLRSMGHRP